MAFEKVCQFSKIKNLKRHFFFLLAKSRFLELLILIFWGSSLTKLATAITMKVVSSLSDVNSWRNGIREILPRSPCTHWPAYNGALDRTSIRSILDDSNHSFSNNIIL